MASRIAAHFTLVFPAEMAEALVVARARTAVQSSESIAVVLRRAGAFPDANGIGYHVCLLAEEGHPELVAVHDALYDGVLAAHRRRDIPFVPHVTVGAHRQRGECERIANLLNEERRIVRVRIDSVDVIAVDASMVRTVAEVPLGVLWR